MQIRIYGEVNFVSSESFFGGNFFCIWYLLFLKLLKHPAKDNDQDESKDGKVDKEKNSEKHNDKSSDSKGDKDSSDKGNEKDSGSKTKDDKSKLRFSKENREKIREQREGRDRRDDRDRGKTSPAKVNCVTYYSLNTVPYYWADVALGLFMKLHNFLPYPLIY